MSDKSRFNRVQEIFHEAFERDPSERGEFLKGACAGDDDLLAEVAALLDADETAEGFMGDPTVADSARAPEVSRRRIGPYKLLQELGEGGYGTVYLAEQEEPVQRRVAVKLIKLGMDTREVVARFEAERQALAMMDHPNIAKVFDGGATESGRPYFVMELVRGLPIDEFCDKNKLPAKERLELFILICQAVHHAHQKGVIHRDIKPSNILVTLHDGTPVPKVIDFGIAKATNLKLTDKTLFTQFQQFVGTPAYVSPEQIEMSGLDVDTRSDIYSLGVLLYDLLTGTTPLDATDFRDQSYLEIQRRILEHEPSRPSVCLSTLGRDRLVNVAASRDVEPEGLRRQLKGELDWIVMKSLEKDRSLRYDSAAALANDVRRHLRDEPVEAGPPSAAYQIRKFLKRCRRNYTVAGLSLLALGLFVAGVVSVFWQWQRAERNAAAESESRRRAESVTTQRELQHVESLFERDQSNEALAWLAYVVRKDPNNRQAARRLVSALTYRSFALPILRSLEHDAPLTEVAWSPDGTFFATASHDQTVKLWDARNGEPLCDPLHHSEKVLFVRITADSRRILSGTRAGARLWDARTGVPLGPIVGGARRKMSRYNLPIGGRMVLTQLDLSSDGLRFAAAFRDRTVIVFDAVTGKRINSLGMGFTSKIMDLEFNLEGDRLAVANLGTLQKGELSVWDVATGEPVMGPLQTEGLVSVGYSPDGTHLIAGGYGHASSTYRVENGTKSSFKMSHQNSITHASFSPDGILAATSSTDGTAQVWNAHTGQKWFGVMGHRGYVTNVRFSSDGLKMVTFGMENSAQFWDSLTGKRLGEAVRLPQAVTSVAFNPSGDAAILGCQDGKAYVFNLLSGKTLPIRFGRGVWNIAFDPEGRRIATAGEHGEIEIWDARTGREITPGPMKHEKWVLTVNFSPDGTKLASASDDGTATVWDLSTGTPAFPAVKHRGRVGRVVFSPDGTTFATASFDGTARIWSSTTGEAMFADPLQHSARLWDVCYSPDGRLLATGGADGMARVWDVATGEPHTDFLPHSLDVAGVEFSPDSRFLATGSSDHAVRLWRVADGSLRWEALQGGPLKGIAFSPDGERLLSSSSDSTAVLRDSQSGDTVSQFMRHQLVVSAVAFSPDGSQVVSASYDGTVRLWNGTTGAPESEPIHHGEKAHRVLYHPSGQRILSSTRFGNAFLWDVPEVPVPLPLQFVELAEGIAGKKIDEEGLIRPVPLDSTVALGRRYSSGASADSLDRWWTWFFADREDRTISSDAVVTVKDRLEELVKEGEISSFKAALHLDPDRLELLITLGNRALANRSRNIATRHVFAERYARLVLLQDPENKEAIKLLGRIAAEKEGRK